MLISFRLVNYIPIFIYIFWNVEITSNDIHFWYAVSEKKILMLSIDFFKHAYIARSLRSYMYVGRYRSAFSHPSFIPCICQWLHIWCEEGEQPITLQHMLISCFNFRFEILITDVCVHSLILKNQKNSFPLLICQNTSVFWQILYSEDCHSNAATCISWHLNNKKI